MERDPDTAAVARANLAGRADVLCADAEEVAAAARAGGSGPSATRPGEPSGGSGRFPRESVPRGRLWRVTDFTFELVVRHPPAGRTAAERVPRSGAAARPGSDDAEAEWLTDHGDTVEVALWAGRSAGGPVGPGLGRRRWHRLVTDPGPTELPVREVGDYLYEPVGAVIRSGASPIWAGGWRPGCSKHFAYLTGDRVVPTLFATAYAVRPGYLRRGRYAAGWPTGRSVAGDQAARHHGRPGELRRDFFFSSRGDGRADRIRPHYSSLSLRFVVFGAGRVVRQDCLFFLPFPTCRMLILG